MHALGIAAVGEHQALEVLDLLHIAKSVGGNGCCEISRSSSYTQKGAEAAGREEAGEKEEAETAERIETLTVMEDWELQTCDSPAPARDSDGGAEEEARGQSPSRQRKQSLILRPRRWSASESL
jgi:hypothetical protein